MKQCRGMTNANQPCKNNGRANGYCRAHQEQAPVAPEAPITGGDSPSVERFRQMHEDRKAGKNPSLFENADALAYLREIMLGVQAQGEEARAFKERVYEVEKRQREQDERTAGMIAKLMARLDDIPEERRERAKARFAAGVQEQHRGGPLEQQVQALADFERIKAAPRTPLIWHGDTQLFGIGGFHIYIIPGMNNPCIRVDPKTRRKCEELPGGVPEPFLPLIEESVQARQAASARKAVLRVDGANYADKHATKIARDLQRVDGRHGVRTGDQTLAINDRIALLPL